MAPPSRSAPHLRCSVDEHVFNHDSDGSGADAVATFAGGNVMGYTVRLPPSPTTGRPTSLKDDTLFGRASICRHPPGALGGGGTCELIRHRHSPIMHGYVSPKVTACPFENRVRAVEDRKYHKKGFARSMSQLPRNPVPQAAGAAAWRPQGSSLPCGVPSAGRHQRFVGDCRVKLP